MKFALIINSYGRNYHSIKVSVESGMRAGFDEILLIDQNSPAMTGVPPQIQHLQFPEKAISKARNFAATATKADYLVFLDDDAELAQDYLKNLKYFLEQFKEAQFIGGRILCQENREEHYSKRQDLPTGKIGILNAKAIMGGNFVIARNLFLKLKGFDENFGIGSTYPSSEDTDLVWKAYAEKEKLYFGRELKVYHPRSTNIDEGKAYLYGLGKGAMVRKWLFEKNKFFALIELMEMIFVSLLKGNWASLKGRLKGLRG